MAELKRKETMQPSLIAPQLGGTKIRLIKRKKATKLYTSPDAFLMKKFVNLLMIAGKKSVAYKIFCAAGFEFLQSTEKGKFPFWQRKQHRLAKKKKDFNRKKKTAKKVQAEYRKKNRFLLKLQTVIKNVQPSVEGRKCRVGGTNKLVPAIVPSERGCSLAIRWIIESARKKKKTSKFPMFRCLAQEFLDAYQKQGRPRQRRDELHKMCEGNRGFLRYRWW